MYPDGDWTFQPAHKAKITQRWCETNLSGFIATWNWHTSSPDLKPLDYSIWDIIESSDNLPVYISVKNINNNSNRTYSDKSKINKKIKNMVKYNIFNQKMILKIYFIV